jgi:hypothetical protein
MHGLAADNRLLTPPTTWATATTDPASACERGLACQVRRRACPARFGVVVFALTLTAFLAPPFSGLDTLPSLGVVVISVGMLLGDGVLAGVGLLVGAFGVALVVGLGSALGHLF